MESGMVDRAHMSMKYSETDYQLWYNLTINKWMLLKWTIWLERHDHVRRALLTSQKDTWVTEDVTTGEGLHDLFMLPCPVTGFEISTRLVCPKGMKKFLPHRHCPDLG